MDKRLEVLSKVDDLKQHFIIHKPIPGFPQPEKTIYDSPEFKEWKEKAKYQLRKLKQSELIDETIVLLDEFNGWNDIKKFSELQAKMHIILDEPQDFLPDREAQDMAKVTKLGKGTVVLTAFDDFTLVKQIGQGGNGKVFSAKDSKGDDVAIKFVKRDESDKKFKRLKNEINFCEKCKHKNIVHVIDRGVFSLDSEMYVFYVMPLYPETLRDKINKGLTPDEAIRIFVGIMQGLKYAHDKGAVHRDIKPENILFDSRNNELVICDFGIAHFSEDDLMTAIETKAGDRLANFQYAAPEQKIKGGAKNVNAKADIYSAALIFNEMFTKEVPQAIGYKKIADVNPEYVFLDRLFEMLYKQNPDERLFPADKVISQLHSLAEFYKNEQVKKQLEEVKISEISVIDFSASIVDKYYRDGNIVFVIDKSLPPEWKTILQSSDFSYSCILGYEPYNLKVTNNMLSMPLKVRKDEAIIKQIVENVYSWIPIVNKEYSDRLKRATKEKQQKEEMELKAKIEELDRNQAINSMLNNL